MDDVYNWSRRTLNLALDYHWWGQTQNGRELLKRVARVVIDKEKIYNATQTTASEERREHVKPKQAERDDKYSASNGDEEDERYLQYLRTQFLRRQLDECREPARWSEAGHPDAR
jgi:hypothetical protein